MIRRHLLVVSLLSSVAAALVLALLGVQLLRWEHQLARDDQLFQATPLRGGLWRTSYPTRFDPSPYVLGIQDDVRYRQALQQFWRAKPGSLAYRPLLPSYIADAQSRLLMIADRDPDTARRSIAWNLIGVLQFSETLPSDAVARAAILRNGIGAFERAVEVDSTNNDAKLNLEMALRLNREDLAKLPLHRGGSTAGAGEGAAGGAGLVGSGY